MDLDSLRRKGPPPCALEATNSDVRILIMSAAASLEDLGALIRASPIFYRDFLSAKTTILLSVGAADLGPAIRDVIILAHTILQPFDTYSYKAYYSRVDETVNEYRKRLLSGSTLWGLGISPEIAVCIVQLNRTIQYFVDLYARVRFAYFERNLAPPLSNGSCTLRPAERHRITQAFIRYQIIINMYCATVIPPRDKDYLFSRIFGLYEPWEMEQVSQADSFAHSLCAALSRLEKTSGRARFIPDVTPDVQHPQDPASSSRSRQGAPTKEAYSVERGWYFERFYSDLPAFRTKLLEATAEDGELMRKILDWPELSNGECRITGHPFLSASDMYRTWPKTPRPPPPSPPCNAVSKSPIETPWGWTYALGGHETRHWGMDLVSLPPDGTPSQQWIEVNRRVQLWRWVGLVFWDKDRVDAMLRTELLAGNAVGWLAAPWD